MLTSVNQRTPLHYLQNLRLTSQAEGADLKAYAPQGLLGRESEVSLSEAAQAIAQGKKVTLKEAVTTPVVAQVSLLGGWKHCNTVVKVVQEVRTPISSAAELEEFNNFKSGERSTTAQQIAAELENKESGEKWGSFTMLLPVKDGLLGRKVEKKFHEPEMDVKIIPSLSAFATARMLQAGRPVAVSNVDTDSVLNSDYSFKENLRTTIVSSPDDLGSV